MVKYRGYIDDLQSGREDFYNIPLLQPGEPSHLSLGGAWSFSADR
jgi:hypothetical protein